MVLEVISAMWRATAACARTEGRKRSLLQHMSLASPVCALDAECSSF